MEESIFGYWWLSEEPDKKYQGCLKTDHNYQNILTLRGIKTAFFQKNLDDHVIFGITEKNKRITLENNLIKDH